MRFAALALVLMFALLGFVHVASAQAPAAPPPPAAPVAEKGTPVGEVDALKLDKLILTQQNIVSSIEVYQARLKAAAEEAPKADAAVKAFVAGLEKGTHTLQRDDKGGYVLVPKPPEAAPAPAPAAPAKPPADKK